MALIDVVLEEYVIPKNIVLPPNFTSTLEHQLAAQRDAQLPDQSVEWIDSEIKIHDRLLERFRGILPESRCRRGDARCLKSTVSFPFS